MLRQQHKKGAKSSATTKSIKKSQPLKLAKRRNQTLRQRVAGNQHYDAVVIGAGIGGVAAALGAVTPALSQNPDATTLKNTAQQRRVLVIEKENDFCFHSTGRSAAIYSEVYGSPTIRALSTATKPFYYTPTKTGLLDPAEDATDNDLVYKRGTIWIATKKSEKDLEEMYQTTKSLVPSLRMISLDEMRTMAPPTAFPATTEKMDYDDELAAIYGEDDGDYKPTLACFEADAADMDVNAIWSAMVKVASHNGAELVNNVALAKAKYDPKTKWSLSLKNQLPDQTADEIEITTDLVINAAGAWADHTNEILGARKHQIQPKQRTIIQFLPEEHAKSPTPTTTNPLDTFNQWPSIFDMHDRYYYKPDAGRILASPCDEIDVDAADVQPDELTVAITVERLKQSSFFDPHNIIHKWAGLRSFAPDREFVLGFDGGNPGSKSQSPSGGFGKDLIHMTGLGGYGIQSAMGNAVCISGLVHNGEFPKQVLDMGLEPGAICPARF